MSNRQAQAVCFYDLYIQALASMIETDSSLIYPYYKIILPTCNKDPNIPEQAPGRCSTDWHLVIV